VLHVPQLCFTFYKKCRRKHSTTTWLPLPLPRDYISVWPDNFSRNTRTQELDRDHKKFGFGSSIRIITDLLSDRPVSPGLFTARPGPQKVSFWELLQQELVFVYHRLAGSDIHRKHTILIWQRDTPCTSNNARHRTETSNHESLADCTKRTRSMSFNNAFLAAMVHTVNAFKTDAIFQKGKKTNYRQRNMK